MPTIDLSSGVWEAARLNASEFCTNQNNASSPAGLDDPASGARIEMEVGLMKMGRADLGQGLVNTLTIAPIRCDAQTNTPIPRAVMRVILPSAQGFINFKLLTFKPATVNITFFADLARTQVVAQISRTYTADGQNRTVEFSRVCEAARVVSIDVPEAALRGELQSVHFDIARRLMGRLLLVKAIYCVIARFLDRISWRFGG